MAWQFCTSGSAIGMAGGNASSINTSGSVLAEYSENSEGEMMLETGMDLSGSFASMAPGIKLAIGNICASKIAMKIIGYDTTGYLSREADTLLNVNDSIINKGIKQLKDFKKLNLVNPL